MPFHGWTARFSIEHHSTVWMDLSSFIRHLLRGVSVASKVWQLWEKALCTSVCGFLCKCTFLRPLGNRQGAQRNFFSNF